MTQLDLAETAGSSPPRVNGSVIPHDVGVPRDLMRLAMVTSARYLGGDFWELPDDDDVPSVATTIATATPDELARLEAYERRVLADEARQRDLSRLMGSRR